MQVEKQTSHYELFKYQPIDFMFDYHLNPYVGKIFKYIVRYPFKHSDPTIDLRKALYTLRIYRDRKHYSEGSNPLYFVALSHFSDMNKNVLKPEQYALLTFLALQQYDELEKELERKIKYYERNGN